MRKSTPVKIKVYYPQTEAGSQELARRVSDVYSDYVVAQIDKMNVPIKENCGCWRRWPPRRSSSGRFPVSRA